MMEFGKEEESHYIVLGTDAKADVQEIKRKYRAAILALHPDKISSHEQALDNHDEEELGIERDRISISKLRAAGGGDVVSRFVRVQEAWEVLRHPDAREKYDKFLSSRRSALELASQDESTKVIWEEILLQDMDMTFADENQRERVFTYLCRCGDYFAVCEEDIRCSDVVLDEALQGKSGIELRAERESKARSRINSLILPCPSCSLHIRVLLYEYEAS